MDYWHKIRQAVGQEPLIIPGAAGAIVQDGKLLLVRHNLLKKWQLPGGVQEIGEAIQQTAEREIREDTMECCKQKVLDWMAFDGRVVFQ